MRPGIVKIQARESIKAARQPPLDSTTYRFSLRFHRNVTAVPFTPVSSLP
jgi:hypothetical protein